MSRLYAALVIFCLLILLQLMLIVIQQFQLLTNDVRYIAIKDSSGLIPSADKYDRFNLNECSWSHANNISKYAQNTWINPHPVRLLKMTLGLRLLIQKTNLTFVLKAGSLLGAYRNGGIIPGDADFDILIPIWMNLNALNHSNINYDNCPIAHQMLSKTLNQAFSATSNNADYNTNLCGLSIVEWIEIVSDYFIKSFGIESPPYIANESKVIGFKWDPYDDGLRGRRHDVWIATTYNEWSSETSNICLCQFNSIMVWCYEDAKQMLLQHYGKQFMVPDRPSKSIQ